MEYIYRDLSEDYIVINRSDMFDAEWYLSNYNITTKKPLKHYLLQGSPKMYNPSPDFDVEWYLTEYKDVKKAKIHPLVHYIRFGRVEGRFPKPFLFDSKYKRDYRIISRSGLFDKEWFSNFYSLDDDVDPIIYYLENGVELGLNPSPDFDTQWYLDEYASDFKTDMDPLVHFIRIGQKEEMFPKPYSFDLKYKSDYFTILNSGLFDKKWFSNFYSLDDDVDPIYYYLENGVELGLNPSPNFDTLWYLDEYGSDIEQDMNPLVHYIKIGVKKHYIPKLYEFEELDDLNLFKTIRGKKNYLFLINDRNNELRHHFDKNYENNFKYVDFIRDYYFKRYLFEKMNIRYYYFIVPDKGFVCKDLIPFKYEVTKRNTSKIDFIPDFIENLTVSDYWRYDTHINFKGAKKLVFNYLKHIDDSFTQEQYEKLISECRVKTINEECDLLNVRNWSYSEKEKKRIKVSKTELHIPQRVHKLKIPEEFMKYRKRDSEYIYNPDSLTNLRVLIFRGSSAKLLKFYLSLYFREIFLYWDYLDLNKELIEWYKPDVILEIRAERFNENYHTPDWLENLIFNRNES